MAIPVAIALGLMGLIKAKQVVDENDEKAKLSDEAKERLEFEPRLNHALNKYKTHAGRNEYAQAIDALLEYADVTRQRGKFSPGDEKLGITIQNLIYKAQEEGKKLSREFKADEQRLKDDPIELSNVHRQYIEKLKTVLPKDDDFLRKEVEHYERLMPKFSLYD